MKKYERGDLPKTDWLDKLTFRRMEEIHAVYLIYWLRISLFNLVYRQRLRSRRTCFSILTCLGSIFLWFSRNRYVILPVISSRYWQFNTGSSSPIFTVMETNVPASISILSSSHYQHHFGFSSMGHSRSWHRERESRRRQTPSTNSKSPQRTPRPRIKTQRKDQRRTRRKLLSLKPCRNNISFYR